MIEPTDEMLTAAFDACEDPMTEIEGADLCRMVAAVLAIVERDYRVVARCADAECERPVGHRASHGCFDGREWVDW